MKKFQLKYSAPKTKVNSAGKVEQQNQKKPDLIVIPVAQ